MARVSKLTVGSHGKRDPADSSSCISLGDWSSWLYIEPGKANGQGREAEG